MRGEHEQNDEQNTRRTRGEYVREKTNDYIGSGFWCGFGESGEAQDTFGESCPYTNNLVVLHSQIEGPVMVSPYPFFLIFLNKIRIINI
jgi:hypothetical protein